MRRVIRTAAVGVLLLPAYALFAYVVMPVSWRQYHRLRGLPAAYRATRTAEGISADPLNVALVGTAQDVEVAMRAAGWCPADRISIRAGIRDAASVVFHRPYPSAPMSTHLLWGRPQDLAFEQIVDGSPRKRHHVRLWRVNRPADPHGTVWLGAASYDRSVGLSSYTGEVVHHIDRRVDEEREKLLTDLRRAGRVLRIDREERWIPRGPSRNGSGDVYETDGRICVAVLGDPSVERRVPPPEEILQVLKESIARSWTLEAAR